MGVKCFVRQWQQSVVVVTKATPISVALKMTVQASRQSARADLRFMPDFYEEEVRSKVTQNNHHLKERTLTAPKENE